MSYKSSNEEQYFPPPSFYFSVEIDGTGYDDTLFQEVSGLEVEQETETISEGGQNTYTWKVPKKVKYPNLVLKRGLLTDDSKLMDWCKKQFTTENTKIEPKNIKVHLEDAQGNCIMTWSVENAWPLKWSVSGFNAQENKIAVESIELAYRNFKIV